jgi:hypothetical protein
VELNVLFHVPIVEAPTYSKLFIVLKNKDKKAVTSLTIEENREVFKNFDIIGLNDVQKWTGELMEYM